MVNPEIIHTMKALIINALNIVFALKFLISGKNLVVFMSFNFYIYIYNDDKN